MRIGVGLESIRMAHAMRLLNPSRGTVDMRVAKASTQVQSQMTVTVSGTVYKKFVLGVHKVDGTGDDLTYIG